MQNATVGIIANPASGKDIRRLVAHGTVFDNQEKVNIVRRVLLGCEMAGVERILYMPDYYGIVEKARSGLRSDHNFRVRLEALPQDLTGTQEDSRIAAQMLADRKVGAIVTMGGDGTNRQVAMGSAQIPLVAVSTGTNNVFPTMLEGTVAGLAAGAVALGLAGPDAVFQAKRLLIRKNGKDVDMALIDAVALRDQFIGSRAMWEVDNMLQAVLTQGEPWNIGIASILGNHHPISRRDKNGAAFSFNQSSPSIFAPIAPGLFKAVGFKDFRLINPGEEVPLLEAPCIIALDGEREVEFTAADTGSIRLDEGGPMVADVEKALASAVKAGFFTRRDLIRRLSS